MSIGDDLLALQSAASASYEAGMRTERERADAIEARLNRLIEQAQDVADWMRRNGMDTTAHGQLLTEALREARATAELAPGHTVMDEYTAKDQAGGGPSGEDET